MKGNFAKTRFVAHAYGERDEVFAGTPPLEVARTLLALTASRNLKETRYIGLFDITAAFALSPANCSHCASSDRPAGLGTLVETCTARNTQSIEALGQNVLKGLEKRRMDLEHNVSGNAAPRQPCSHEHVSR